jgi:hypothetical protein
VPLLGEALDPVTLGFALAVVAVVFLGRRFASGAAATPVATTTPASPLIPATATAVAHFDNR